MKFDSAPQTPDIEAGRLGPLLADAGFQRFCEALPDACFVLLPDGTVAQLNQAAERHLRTGRAEALGRPLARLAERAGLDWAPLAAALRSGRKGEVLLADAAGRRLLASLRVLRDERRQAQASVVVLRDLQLLDHQRRTGEGGSAAPAFALAGERAARPDFQRQRRLSAALDQVFERAERAALQGVRVLLTGEPGVGKTELARHLRDLLAGGAPAPFIHINCAAVPESLFESEMFGYERGAFTGAHSAGKPGLIEAAEGGVLFLDEIGEAPLACQAKLLRFLEDGTLQRVGGAQARQVRCYVISATNRDLGEMVAAGRFRADLYWRLAVVRLEVPPLRAQPALLEHLVDHFLAAQNRGRPRPLTLDPAARAALLAHGWPGNVRELSNAVQHLAALADERALPEHLPTAVLQAPAPVPATSPAQETLSLRALVRGFERQVIEAAIRSVGSKRKAAQLLGVDVGTIVRKTQAREEEG